MEKNSYFIKIENPVNSRRNILECTRDILKTLKDFEAFKTARHERAKLIESFKKQTNELRILVKEIRRMLPKMAAKTTRKTYAEPTIEKPVIEVRKLEEELADIESKLNEL